MSPPWGDTIPLDDLAEVKKNRNAWIFSRVHGYLAKHPINFGFRLLMKELEDLLNDSAGQMDQELDPDHEAALRRIGMDPRQQYRVASGNSS